MNDDTLPDDSHSGGAVPRTPSGFGMSDFQRAVAGAFTRDLSGTTLGGYRLVRKLAEGGMGEVYEAVQTALDRKVALKLLTARLTAQPEFQQRFEREAKAAAALNHPNVVQVHDFGQTQGHAYLVMEFIEGEDLAEHVVKHGKLSVAEGLAVIEQAARALKAAHEKSIVHRDIKPSNLMRTRDGRVKVSDLGLAKVLTEDTDITQTGASMGSPHFLAPEQADDARSVDHRADIYALGITLLYLLTGKKPFEGTSAFSVVLSHANKPLPTGLQLGTELPAAVEELIRKMAAKRPGDRYQDYDSLLADLERVKAGFAPKVDLARLARGRRAVLAGSFVLIAAVIGAGIYWRQNHRPPPDVPAKSAAPLNSKKAPSPDFDRGEGDRPSGSFRGPPPGGAPGRSGRIGRLPMPPPRQELSMLADGPPAAMMAKADEYAAANPTQYVVNIDNYNQVGERARGTALEAEARKKEARWAVLHNTATEKVLREFEQKMIEKVKAGRSQEAFEVWRDFPDSLRTKETDDQIFELLDKHLPADFQPQSRPPGRQPPPP